MEKSKCMGSKAITSRKLNALASTSPIRLIGNLGRYLGFPLLQGRLKKEDFDHIFEKSKSYVSFLEDEPS